MQSKLYLVSSLILQLPLRWTIFKQSLWNVFFLCNSPLLAKFIVIVKQKNCFGVIFLLLWLSEHTQGGRGGGCVWGLTINIYFTHLKFYKYMFLMELEFDTFYAIGIWSDQVVHRMRMIYSIQHKIFKSEAKHFDFVNIQFILLTNSANMKNFELI